MAVPKPLLSILRTEYETPAVGEWVTSRRADVEDSREADHTTSEGARSAAVAYWKDESGSGPSPGPNSHDAAAPRVAHDSGISSTTNQHSIFGLPGKGIKCEDRLLIFRKEQE